MNIIRTDLFKKDFKQLPEEVKRHTEKALGQLATNPYHPSLNVKKTKGLVIKGYGDIFAGRITRNYMFLFLIGDDCCILARCGKHDDFF